MTSVEALNSISQQIHIYFGMFMFIFGLIGCLWNLLIFRHHSLRLSSCCTYMLIGSLASLVRIIFGLLNRILLEGFQFDWPINSVASCKIRNYIAFCSSLTSLSCLVLATIDRFFSTCRQIKWRSFNTVYVAKEVCLLTIILWMVTGIPTLIYTMPIQRSQKCVISSLLWSKFSTYIFNLFVYGILPWLSMTVFALLALRNIHRSHDQRINPISLKVITRTSRVDHQLLTMLSFQIMISALSSIPYCVQNIYDHLTQLIIKDEYRQAQDNLFYQLVHLIFYLNYISMFYANYLFSPIFRNLSKKVLVNLCKNKDVVSREITIINHQTNDKQIKQKQLNIATIPTPYAMTHV